MQWLSEGSQKALPRKWTKAPQVKNQLWMVEVLAQQSCLREDPVMSVLVHTFSILVPVSLLVAPLRLLPATFLRNLPQVDLNQLGWYIALAMTHVTLEGQHSLEGSFVV
jgi:hypothetical protein